MEEEIKNTKLLLEKVTSIRNKYDEINRLTGANYNVFNVLRLQSDEVRLHSRFIGDLLNPNGKHGRGDVFLELFLEQIQTSLNGNSEKSFSSENAKIYIEKSIGLINDEKTEGGQIDLMIEDIHINRIIIENKIYAEDQKNQLLRYHNYDKKALLLYLTLYDKEASDESVTREDGSKLKKGKEYFNITYKKDVKEWLEKCLPHTTQFPFLRESISQYLNIVKQLTGQSMNKDMDNEVKGSIINSSESYKAAQLISKNLNSARSALLGGYRDLLQKELEKCLNLNEIKYHVELTNKLSSKTQTQIVFDIEGKKQIIFEISRMLLPISKNSKKYSVNPQVYFGLRYNNNKNDKMTIEIEELNKKLGSIFESNKWWLAKIVSDDNFKTNYISLADKNKLMNNVSETVEMMKKTINEYLA